MPMAFLRPPAVPDNALDIQGVQVYLRPPVMGDYQMWFEARAASRDHLTPWEPQWARDELTRAAFRRRVRHYQAEQSEDLGYAFFLFDVETDQLVGGLTLSHIRRGVAQAAALGYWMAASATGRGLMTDAVRAVVPFAFKSLRLHRVEAACLTNNVASIRVLEKCGFQREGLARRYLRINGTWHDHMLFAVLDDDPQPSRNASAPARRG
jgi:[ribosomal protein S5]-alanine N-acetyltransferase